MVFHYIPSAFHCSFSLHTQCISFWFFKCIPVYFTAIFHYIPSAFHCDFSFNTQQLSLQFFKCIPGYFIAIFNRYPQHFIVEFLNVALDISLQISYGCLVLSMTISFLAPEYFIVLKIARKWEQKIGMVYRISGTACRVYCIYQKSKFHLLWWKSEEKQDKDDFHCQGPSNRSLGGWSHDQLPKMVKKRKL